MAALTATSMGGTGSRTVTDNTLTASDTLTYQAGRGQILIVNNDTGAEVTLNIDGDGQTAVVVPGIGSVDVSGGLDVVIAIGAVAAIPLDTIKQYLTGTVTLTGASGAQAYFLQY